MSLRSTVFTPDARGVEVHLPVRRVSGKFQGIRQPLPRGRRKHPGPLERRRLEQLVNNEKRRICVQEGVRCLSALIVSRAVEQILFYSCTPHMLRTREGLIAYIIRNNPRISRPSQMKIVGAEPFPGSDDLIQITVQFYPNRHSRSQRSCVVIGAALSFYEIVRNAFASRRLRRVRLIA